jgi:hypothetical protein
MLVNQRHSAGTYNADSMAWFATEAFFGRRCPVGYGRGLQQRSFRDPEEDMTYGSAYPNSQNVPPPLY